MPAVASAVARLLLVGLGYLAVASCSAPAPEPQDKEEAAALGRDTDETVFDDLIQTQDKARAVEDVTMSHKKALDSAIDASSGDTGVVDDPDSSD